MVGICIRKYVELGEGVKFVVWFISVLVGFHVEDVNWDWYFSNHSANCLDDVKVRGQHQKSWGDIGDRAIDVINDRLVVNRKQLVMQVWCQHWMCYQGVGQVGCQSMLMQHTRQRLQGVLMHDERRAHWAVVGRHQ